MVECLQTYDFFRSYVSPNQFPGNKKMIISPFSESWILNPEAMNPDLESIIKKTNISYNFAFSQENIFTELDYLKQRQIIRLRSVSKKPMVCLTLPASRGF